MAYFCGLVVGIAYLFFVSVYFYIQVTMYNSDNTLHRSTSSILQDKIRVTEWLVFAH